MGQIKFNVSIWLSVFFCLMTGFALQAQEKNDSTANFDFEDPQKYIIEDIDVKGLNFTDKNQVITISGLIKGDEVLVPGDPKFSQAVKRLWGQRFFGDVDIHIAKIEGNKVWIEIVLSERSRIYTWEITGIRKGQKKDLEEKVNLKRGMALSDYAVETAINKIKAFYHEKGFYNTSVTVSKRNDTTVKNAVHVTLHVDKKEKIKISEIVYEGNSAIKGSQLRGSMKKTKQKGFALKSIFKSRKYIEKNYIEDKANLIAFYNQKGYRDAQIITDSLYPTKGNKVGLKLKLFEGKRYYFRNIDWVGNTKYATRDLASMLKIQKGDVYDQATLDKRLTQDEQSVATYFYQDHGYIFSHLIPIETNIVNDSIDVEIRVFEGDQATYNKINIYGNNKTNEHVIRRELETVPGDLFSVTKFRESIRMLSQMGHFDPEELMKSAGGFIKPNQVEGTVDLNYTVSEKSSDQLELSGGWGANMFVGSVGVKFTNFSMSRVFNPKAWRPVPSGDAQTLGLRFQTNGKRYQQFSVNFMEPWLGGRKPISLSVSAYYSRQTSAYNPYQNSGSYGGYGGYGGGYNYYNNYDSKESMQVIGMSAGLGHRLKWPDHRFSLYYELSLQRYQLNNWEGGFIFNNGNSNNFSFKVAFGRKSIDQPIFTRRGSDVSVTAQITPPYSLIGNNRNKNYLDMPSQEKYKWIEYNKWTFNGAFFTPIVGDLILHARAQFGYLGYYNKKWGYSPFEGFVVGGDGMSGYVMYGQDIIALRGYENNSLTPYYNNAYQGNVYNKYTMEIRYPVILQPQSQIYLLTFLEAGNAWDHIDKFNPFDTKRAAGFGVRIFLPIVGTLGIDWGYGFDKIVGRPSANGSNFHFVIGQSF